MDEEWTGFNYATHSWSSVQQTFRNSNHGDRKIFQVMTPILPLRTLGSEVLC